MILQNQSQIVLWESAQTAIVDSELTKWYIAIVVMYDTMRASWVKYVAAYIKGTIIIMYSMTKYGKISSTTHMQKWSNQFPSLSALS